MPQANIQPQPIQGKVGAQEGLHLAPGAGGLQQALVELEGRVVDAPCQPKTLALGKVFGVVQQPQDEVLGLAEDERLFHDQPLSTPVSGDWGAPPPTRPPLQKGRSPETRRPESQRAGDTEPDISVTLVRRAVGPEGGADIVRIEGPRAPPHHTAASTVWASRVRLGRRGIVGIIEPV